MNTVKGIGPNKGKKGVMDLVGGASSQSSFIGLEDINRKLQESIGAKKEEKDPKQVELDTAAKKFLMLPLSTLVKRKTIGSLATST